MTLIELIQFLITISIYSFRYFIHQHSRGISTLESRGLNAIDEKRHLENEEEEESQKKQRKTQKYRASNKFMPEKTYLLNDSHKKVTEIRELGCNQTP